MTALSELPSVHYDGTCEHLVSLSDGAEAVAWEPGMLRR